MPSHRRGRSLSEALTLEQSEEGGLIISSINSASPNQGLKEGDEILGATINFNQLSKDEVMKVLKLMEPFDEKVQVLTRNNLSKSLENLDQCVKTPEMMLKESYNKLYNGKIKKFMRADALDPEEDHVSLKHDSDLPRLGVDFGILKPKTKGDFQPPAGEVTYGSNLNLPPLGLGLNETTSGEAPIPRLKLDATSPQLNTPDFQVPRTLPEGQNLNSTVGVPQTNTDSPSVHLAMPNLEMPEIDLESKSNTPEVGVDLKGPNLATPELGIDVNRGNITGPSINVGVPKVGIEEPNQEFKMPKFKIPDLGLSGPSLNGPECDAKTSAVEIPDVPSGKLSIKSKRLKSPALNLDDPSSYVESPKLSLSGRSPDLDMEMPDINASQLDVKGSDIDMSLGGVKVPHKKLRYSLKSPDLDVDAPAKFTLPRFGFSGKGEADVKTSDVSLETPKIKAPELTLPKVDLKAQNLTSDTSTVDIKGSSGKYKAPKFTMPKFDLPDIEVPGLKRDLEGPDVHLAAPDLKTGMAGIGLSGPKIKTPDIDISVPRIKGGVDTMDPKLDLNTPDVELPSGKLNIDADSHSGKMKLPKFKLFGTLPKKKDLDVNAGIKTPDLNLKSPKMKGLEAPDLNVDLKASNLGIHSPDMNTGSPKGKLTLPRLKMPNFDLSGPKGGNINMDASLNKPDMSSGGLDVELPKPDFDIDTPSLDLKGPKSKLNMPDVKMGKMKIPSFTAPDFDLSGPTLKGIDRELKTPDLNLSSPQLKGSFSSPDMPDVDLHKPQLNLSGPDANLHMPSGKFQMPKLKGEIDGPDVNMPQVDLKGPNANLDIPSGKLKIPKFNLSGTLPKGPNLDVNADVKSPDWSLKAPKIKGGIDGPDIDLPNMDLKAPKLDVNTPDINIGSPKTKLKFPKMKKPKFNFPGFKGPDFDGNLDGPDVDINAPNVNLKGSKADLDLDISGPSGKLKKPNLNLPDFGLSGAKLDGPNLDFKSPDLDLSGPNLSGGLKGPDMNMPKVDLKGPNANLDMPSGKLKMPELHAPDWDVNGHSSKLKMPKFNLSGTLPKGPNLNVDADLKSPDLSLKAPKIKGGIDGPDIDLPNMDLKAPKLDVNTPDVNIGSPKTKLKFPKMKKPKFNFPGFKRPDFDGNLDGPDVDINAPNVNLKGPKADLDLDISGPSGKLKKPNLNLPDFGLSGAKLDGPNLDFKSPDLDLSGPNLSGGLKGPDMPNIDFKSPKLDLNTPKLNLDTPTGKMKMPDLSLKGAVDAPDLDLPNMDLKAPKLDMNTPDVNIGSPKMKMKMPKFKMPKVSLPSPKGPEIDGKLDVPDIDVSAPKLNLKGSKNGFELPDVDFGSSSGTFKTPHLKFPDVGFSSPQLDSPNFDLDKPDLNVNLPKGTLKLNSDLKTPDLSLKAPKIKAGLDAPKLAAPKMDFKAPKLDVNHPDINIDDVNIKGPKLDLSAKHPDLEISGDVGEPKMTDFTGPQVKDIRGPEMYVTSGSFHHPQTDLADRKFKLPSLKRPQFGSPDLNGIGSDIDFGAPLRPKNVDISPPNAKLSMKQADLKANITGPKVSAPNVDLSLHKTAMHNPQLDLKSHDLNTDDPSGKFKKPSYKSRKSTGANMKIPDLDIDGDVRLHHTGGRSPRTKARSSYPVVDGVTGNHIDFNRSDLNIDDFTGKDHVLRARGSTLDLQTAQHYAQMASTSAVNINTRDPRKSRKIPPGDNEGSKVRAPNSSDGYYVTVFPTQTQNTKIPNRKYNTLGRLNFDPGNVDLEVPSENDIKGSTFFFSNLV